MFLQISNTNPATLIEMVCQIIKTEFKLKSLILSAEMVLDFDYLDRIKLNKKNKVAAGPGSLGFVPLPISFVF
jgi:hypothetical protein